MNGLGRNSSLPLLTLSGERVGRRDPLSVLAALFLYNRLMSIVEDIYPVRRDIDDQIDELDELGIL